MANKRFAKVVRDQIAEAVAQGAKPLIDPAHFPADDGGAYLAPQILVNVTHGMRVMMEESFGPVVGIMKVSSDEEALNRLYVVKVLESFKAVGKIRARQALDALQIEHKRKITNLTLVERDALLRELQ